VGMGDSLFSLSCFVLVVHFGFLGRLEGLGDTWLLLQISLSILSVVSEIVSEDEIIA
jgi:hypothetical protein